MNIFRALRSVFTLPKSLNSLSDAEKFTKQVIDIMMYLDRLSEEIMAKMGTVSTLALSGSLSPAEFNKYIGIINGDLTFARSIIREFLSAYPDGDKLDLLHKRIKDLL